MTAIARANVAAAEAIVDELARSGIREACISPGSRSAPLVLALAREARIRKWVITDERSAAFFALGMARSSRRPVLVVSTSGTAAANFLPAIVEASLAAVPLLVFTADRPTELRDCGAAQTIRQPGLFASHARWSVDAAVPQADTDLGAYYRTLACRAVAVAAEPPCGPVHVNLPLREPLFDAQAWLADHEFGARAGAADLERSGAAGSVLDAHQDRPRADGMPWVRVHASEGMAAPATCRALLEGALASEKGVIVCGPGAVRADAASAVVELADRLGWPILADPLSGLRHGPHDRTAVVDAYDVVLRSARAATLLAPDAVLRFGGLPSSKPLLAWLAGVRPCHDVLVSRPGLWTDPAFSLTEVIRAEAAALCATLAAEIDARPRSEWLSTWLGASGVARQALSEAAAGVHEPFEAGVAIELLRSLPQECLVCVGNSMPVRDVDTFTACSSASVELIGSRGASGIDGVVSAALGAAAVETRRVALLVGDLSFLHDLGALQIAHRHALSLAIVVVNNDGGGIFSHLPQAALGETFERYFVTPHGLDLEPAVVMVGGRYHRPAWGELGRAIADGVAREGLDVIDARVDRAFSAGAHDACIAAAVGRLDAFVTEAA